MANNDQQQDARGSLGNLSAAEEATYPTDENILEQCHQIFSDLSEALLIFLRAMEATGRTNTATPTFQPPRAVAEQADALAQSLLRDRQVGIPIDVLSRPMGVSEFISTAHKIFEGPDENQLLSRQILTIYHVYMGDCWAVLDPHTRPITVFYLKGYNSLWWEALSEKCRIRELRAQEYLSTHPQHAYDD
ncbi:hypothetical protein HBH98_035540 [Parastagonospora nodorum]|nr:hypothetical protein HBH42_071910 [Parastagonospora nodorum]KAH4351912.1 hypothetical protein HBH98_035540 [Parastagonospora nodorum]KAH4396375.1 hypothetical protein HBH97_020130 [Parastagonospora nodorum]KAH4427495.1 hypothetical protein HBH99_024440 [Parastagonospora nodorum]KAH5044119.1 hypothetical protein HBI75_034830 [Parastagonospora nodorum]